MKRTTKGHARRLVAALAVTVGVSGSLGAFDAGAQVAGGPFTGVAAADAYRATVAVPDFLIVEKIVDGGGASAQAAVDSGGSSTAYASLPDPGETVIAAPGLVSIVTGSAFPFTYPLYVSTQHPTTTEDSIDQPGYHLRADSGLTRSGSSAQLGERTDGAEGGFYATADVERLDDGTVVSRARAAVESLRIGALEIAGFESTATVTRAPNSPPERETSTDIGRISLAGVPLEWDEDGISAADAPLGAALPVDVDELAAASGIQIEQLPVIENADGIVAAGLRIRTTVPIPNIGSEGQVEIVLGRVSAAATALAFPGSVTPAAPVVPGDGALEPAAPVGSITGIDATGELVSPAPASADTSASPAPTPVAAAPVSAPALGGTPLRIEAGYFFPILVVAGLLLGGMTKAFALTRSIRWN